MSFLLDTNILWMHLRRPDGGGPPLLPAFRPSLHIGGCPGGVICLGPPASDPVATIKTIDELFMYEVNVVDFDRTCLTSLGGSVSSFDVAVSKCLRWT